MSLVAYGSSDESSDEEVTSNHEVSEKSNQKTPGIEINNKSSNNLDVKAPSKVVEVPEIIEDLTLKPRFPISLPTPKTNHQEKVLEENSENDSLSPPNNDSKVNAPNLNVLPEPKRIEIIKDITEEDDIPPAIIAKIQVERPPRKKNGPVQITIPSLSEFKDLDEETEKSRNRIKPSQKGTGLLGMLPPASTSVIQEKSKPLVPRVLQKAPPNPKIPPKSQQQKFTESKKMQTKKSAIESNYDSGSEDEETGQTHTVDFFSFTSSKEIPTPAIPIEDIIRETSQYSKSKFSDLQTANHIYPTANEEQQSEAGICEKMLVSNVMNLPRNEIIQKNKAEIGPKLPVPEQDYYVDSTGNLAVDEKAIEYLCGKRGVKRKNKEFENIEFIEIDGDKNKPDEREWLVKALTEPEARPVSLQTAGPSGQSKKKHQITYLAHQAKAMEVELKNQWAQNKMSRQQTQSKYGF